MKLSDLAKIIGRQHIGAVVILCLSLVLMGASQASLMVLVGPLLSELANLTLQKKTFIVFQFFPSGVVQDFAQKILGSWSLTLDEMVVWVPLTLCAFGMLRVVSNFVFELTQAHLSLSLSQTLRDRLLSKVLMQPLSVTLERSTGRWMSMIINDIQVLQSRVSEIAITFVRDSVLLTVSFLALVLIHVNAGIFAMVAAPILGLIAGKIGSRISAYAESWQRAVGKIASHVLDLRARFDFVRAQRAEKFELRRFDAINQHYYREILSSIFLRSAFSPSVEFIGFASLGIALWVYRDGSWIQLTSEQWLQFFAAIGLMIRPLRNFSEQLTRWHEVRGALRNVGQTLEAKRDDRTIRKENKKNFDTALAPLSSHLSIHRLEYSNNKGFKLAIRDIEIRKDRCIGIVGPSGSGKSTFAKILVGLVPPDLFESNIELASWVSHTGFVSQEPFVFSDTLRSNLNYGLSQPKHDTELLNALAKVNLTELVSNDPKGLSMPLTSLQSNISGGQLQRVTIARALLRNPQILVLDEATSALDAHNERDIVERLVKWSRAEKSGIILITHRTGVLDLFDEIWEMNAGQLNSSRPRER